MNRDIKKLRKASRGSIKAGRWIGKHRKKMLSAATIEILNKTISKLQDAIRSGDLKTGRSSLKKLNGLLEGEASSARKSKFREWTESIVFALIMVFVIRNFIVEPFKIPTGSMTPTLLGVVKICPTCGREYRYDDSICSVDGTSLDIKHVGDKILVTKFLYGARTPDRIPFTGILLPFLQLPAIRSPHRGDIIVFHFPDDLSVDYVKRLIGLPGEKIEIKNGRILADGQDADTPAMEKVHYRNLGNFGRAGQTFTIPYRGMEIPLEPGGRIYWSDIITRDGHKLAFKNGTVLIDGTPRKKYLVEQDYYYALGDNSSNSKDSRYWGFVPEKYLVGRVFFKYWPPKRWGFTD